jgi:hypothetical protein
MRWNFEYCFTSTKEYFSGQHVHVNMIVEYVKKG